MGYGLSVVNVVASPDTTIGQYGTPVTMSAAYPLSNIATRQLSKIAKTDDLETYFALALTNTITGFGINPIVGIMAIPAAHGTYKINIVGSNVAMGDSDLFYKSTDVSSPSFIGDPSLDEFPLSCFVKLESDSPTYIMVEIFCSGTVPLEIGGLWAGPSVVSTERSDSLVGGLYLGGSNASSAGGQAYGATAKSLRQCQVSIERLLDVEKQEIMRALSYAGKGRPFVYMRETADSTTDQNNYKRDNSFYCHLEGEVNFTTQAARDLNTVTFGFVEER